MKEKVFQEYKINSRIDINIINKYKEKIPNELMCVWKEYGFGSVLGGYLKIINPEEYKSILDMSYFRSNESIPISVTAFGDVINWKEGN